jgi:uncharacterized protein (DUF111 family)
MAQVTPTGAAIIVSIADSFEAMPQMTVEKIGYGAGKNDIGSRPNLLRVITGTALDSRTENHTEYQKDKIVVVETCIDDMNPEIFGFLMDRLFADGVLDVLWIPVFMKKNRPGTMIQVLCQDEIKDMVIDRILSETTSLGIRYYYVQRRFLERKRIKIKTEYGKLYVKQVKGLDGNVRIVPEYEACRKIAIEKDIPIRKVYDTIAGNTEGKGKRHPSSPSATPRQGRHKGRRDKVGTHASPLATQGKEKAQRQKRGKGSPNNAERRATSNECPVSSNE